MTEGQLEKATFSHALLHSHSPWLTLESAAPLLQGSLVPSFLAAALGS